MKIAIVIRTYNVAQILGRTLDQVARQSEQAEIILDVLWRIEAGDISHIDGRNEIDTRLQTLDESRLAAN